MTQRLALDREKPALRRAPRQSPLRARRFKAVKEGQLSVNVGDSVRVEAVGAGWALIVGGTRVNAGRVQRGQEFPVEGWLGMHAFQGVAVS